MKTKYTIKDFRVFDKNGVTVDFAPLTFLVGCNSSGKSSIVKSLTLLKTFFKNKFDKDHPVIGSTIDFSAKPNNTLGSFNNVVRTGSRKKEVALSYEVYSSYLDEDVVVALTLGKGELGNAIITAIEISKKDGTVLITANSDSDYPGGSLVSIKEAFKQYLIATRLRMDPYNHYHDPHIQEPEEEYNKRKQDALQYCAIERLMQVKNNPRIKDSYSDEYVKAAIDKYAETGIMTYYSVFDEMGGMTSPEEVSSFLKSKVKEGETHDAMMKVIDIVSEWFKNSDCPDFASFYRYLEDNQLMNSDYIRANSWLNPAKIDFQLIVGDYSRFNVEESASSIYEESNYRLVKDMLDCIVEDEPYSHFDFESDPIYGVRIHPLYTKSFNDFVRLFCSEVVSTDITEDIEYISSSRIQVRRMYPLEDRNEFSDAVRRYFETKAKFMDLNPPITVHITDADGKGFHQLVVSDFTPESFINKWLRVFKIGDHVSLEMDKNDLGLLLKVCRSASDKKGVLLADMGYGITQLFSILLQIEEMIMSAHNNRFKGLIRTKRGTPILDYYEEIPFEPHTLAIEEPEIHLHPKYQSLLAEMFYEVYKDYNIQFLIETHSEYLLRKIQTLVGAKKLTPEEVSMVYVEDDEEMKNGAQKVRRILIKEDGCLSSPFGRGFYDEADSLAMTLLRIKAGLE